MLHITVWTHYIFITYYSAITHWTHYILHTTNALYIGHITFNILQFGPITYSLHITVLLYIGHITYYKSITHGQITYITNERTMK